MPLINLLDKYHLTDTQTRMLTFIRTEIARGITPSQREIAAHMKWKNVQSLRAPLVGLAKMGFVYLAPGVTRNIRLTPNPPLTLAELYHEVLMGVRGYMAQPGEHTTKQALSILDLRLEKVTNRRV